MTKSGGDGSSGNASTASLAVRHVGQYQLLDQLGHGGMGVVYKAVHTRLKRFAAIKFIRPDLALHETVLRRFFREIELLGQCDHPNVLRAYEAGEWQGQAFLAVEFVEGCNAYELVRGSERLPIGIACGIVRDAAVGLQHLHERGIIHRDIKPQNLLLAKSGEVKVSDLGLARHNWQEDNGGITNSEDLVGTVDYISPEMLRSKDDLNCCSDIYSLGCTFYFLLTGRPPFHGAEYDTVLKKIYGHAHAEPPPLAALRPDAPPGVIAVLSRAMRKASDERFCTAGEMAGALAPWCDSLTSWPSFGRLNTASLSAADLPSSTQKSLLQTDVVPASRPGRRTLSQPRRIAAIVSGVLLLILAVAAVALALQLRLPRPADEQAAIANRKPSVEKITRPTVAPAFQDLTTEQMEVGRWYSLLERAPVRKIWPQAQAEGNSILQWQSTTQQADLSIYGLGLIELGIVPDGVHDFRLELRFNRPSWREGSVGVYLGFRDTATDRAAFQVLAVTDSRQKSKPLALLWREMTLELKNGRVANSSTTDRGGSLVDQPGFRQAARMELWVENGRLARVLWNGAPLSGVDIPAEETPSFSGTFGIFVDGATATLLEARVQLVNLP
jgi:serine/threonine protein kinase